MSGWSPNCTVTIKSGCRSKASMKRIEIEQPQTQVFQSLRVADQKPQWRGLKYYQRNILQTIIASCRSKASMKRIEILLVSAPLSSLQPGCRSKASMKRIEMNNNAMHRMRRRRCCRSKASMKRIEILWLWRHKRDSPELQIKSLNEEDWNASSMMQMTSMCISCRSKASMKRIEIIHRSESRQDRVACCRSKASMKRIEIDVMTVGQWTLPLGCRSKASMKRIEISRRGTDDHVQLSVADQKPQWRGLKSSGSNVTPYGGV